MKVPQKIWWVSYTRCDSVSVTEWFADESKFEVEWLRFRDFFDDAEWGCVEVTTAAQLAKLTAERDEAVQVLRLIEWDGDQDDGAGRCPFCLGISWKGHAADCDLAAIINSPEGREGEA